MNRYADLIQVWTRSFASELNPSGISCYDVEKAHRYMSSVWNVANGVPILLHDSTV
jgi:hypothetical protein